MEQKLTGMDKITKAILPDINWKTLTANAEDIDPSWTGMMAALDAELVAFREVLSEKISDIVFGVSNDINENNFAEASSDDIYYAASEMASKYHSRSVKSGKRRRHNPATKKSITNPTPTKSPTQPSSKSSPTAPTKPATKLANPSSSKSATRSETSFTPKSVPRTEPKVSNTGVKPQGRHANYPEKITKPTDSRPKPIQQIAKITTHRPVKIAARPSNQATMKKYCKTVKLARPTSPPLPTFGDFFKC